MHLSTYSKLRPASAGRVMRDVGRQGDIVTVERMDNVGIVVEDLDAAIEFFAELGLELAQQLGQQTSRKNPMGRRRREPTK